MNRFVRPAAKFCMIAAGAVALCSGALAEPPVLKDEFEEKSDGWIAMGPHAKMSVSTEAGKAKNGKGALKFTYTIPEKPLEAPKDGGLPIDLLLRTTSVGELAKMKSLRFWAKGETATPLVVSLTEKDGGRYIAPVWIGKEGWQEIILAPEDFVLTDDVNDPKDPNNKLDVDKIENIGFLDVLSMFAPAINAAGAGGFSDAGLHIGNQTLLIDDFTISTEPVPATPAGEKNTGAIDLFEKDHLRWFALGEVAMSLDKSAPTKTRALRADYKQGDGGYLLLIRTVHNLKASSDDNFVIDVAAAKSSRLNVTMEEKNGASYTLTLSVPGDSEPIQRSLPLSSFILSEGKTDDNGKLDLDKVKSFSITDITGAFGIAKQKNTLWIGPVRFQKK